MKHNIAEIEVSHHTQAPILRNIIEERKRQDEKWGEQNHPLVMWGTIIGEEFGEMCECINKLEVPPISYDPSVVMYYTEALKKEAIQVAACCVALLEYIERDK